MKYVVTLNGKRYEVEVNQSEAVLCGVTEAAPPTAQVAPLNVPAPAPAVPAAPAQSAQPAAEGEQILAPMPGTILSVNVAQGEAVKTGQVLVVLEAMKMENEIVAPADGVVRQILTQKGATVNTDDILLVI